MLNLKELEASLDDALKKETAESLADWFKEIDENKSSLTRRTAEELKEARCSAYEYLIK